MAGTLSLVELGKLTNDPLEKSVIDTFLEFSQIMKWLPWETTGRLYKKGTKIKTLPNVAKRRMNEGWESSTGKTEPFEEGIALVGGNIDVDKEAVDEGDTIENVRAIQQYMKVKAMTASFNYDFINASLVADPKSFNGLKARCNKAANATQKIACGTTTNIITADATNALAFVAEMDRFIGLIANRTPTFVLTNEVGLRTMTHALRLAGVLRIDKDQYGTLTTMWGNSNIPIYDVGLQADDTTAIMGDEAIDGTDWSSGNYYFSLYAVKIGKNIDFRGIQKRAMAVRDIGLLEDAVTYRTNIDWPVGLFQPHKRCLARMHGIRYA